eukprot:g11029.t1
MDGMVAGHEDPISAAQRGVVEANDPRLHFQRGQTLLADCESPRPYKSLMGEKQTKIAVDFDLKRSPSRKLSKQESLGIEDPEERMAYFREHGIPVPWWAKRDSLMADPAVAAQFKVKNACHFPVNDRLVERLGLREDPDIDPYAHINAFFDLETPAPGDHVTTPADAMTFFRRRQGEQRSEGELHPDQLTGPQGVAASGAGGSAQVDLEDLENIQFLTRLEEQELKWADGIERCGFVVCRDREDKTNVKRMLLNRAIWMLAQKEQEKAERGLFDRAGVSTGPLSRKRWYFVKAFGRAAIGMGPRDYEGVTMLQRCNAERVMPKIADKKAWREAMELFRLEEKDVRLPGTVTKRKMFTAPEPPPKTRTEGEHKIVFERMYRGLGPNDEITDDSVDRAKGLLNTAETVLAEKSGKCTTSRAELQVDAADNKENPPMVFHMGLGAHSNRDANAQTPPATQQPQPVVKKQSTPLVVKKQSSGAASSMTPHQLSKELTEPVKPRDKHNEARRRASAVGKLSSRRLIGEVRELKEEMQAQVAADELMNQFGYRSHQTTSCKPRKSATARKKRISYTVVMPYED